MVQLGVKLKLTYLIKAVRSLLTELGKREINQERLPSAATILNSHDMKLFRVKVRSRITQIYEKEVLIVARSKSDALKGKMGLDEELAESGEITNEDAVSEEVKLERLECSEVKSWNDALEYEPDSAPWATDAGDDWLTDIDMCLSWMMIIRTKGELHTSQIEAVLALLPATYQEGKSVSLPDHWQMNGMQLWIENGRKGLRVYGSTRKECTVSLQDGIVLFKNGLIEQGHQITRLVSHGRAPY